MFPTIKYGCYFPEDVFVNDGRTMGLGRTSINGVGASIFYRVYGGFKG
jgi:hypothetical protein